MEQCASAMQDRTRDTQRCRSVCTLALGSHMNGRSLAMAAAEGQAWHSAQPARLGGMSVQLGACLVCKIFSEMVP